MHFNLETIVRVYDHTCQNYVGHSQKRNAMPKGNELTLRIHSLLQWVYCKSHSRKISTQCFYHEVGQFSVELLDLWLNGNMLSLLNSSSARNVWRKKEKTIFTSWCLIAKNMEISDSQKFLSVLQSKEGPQHSSLGTTTWSVYFLLPHITWHHCTWINFQAFTYWKQSNRLWKSGTCKDLFESPNVWR